MKHISWMHHEKIYDIFKHFKITKQTDIYVQDTVDWYNPLMLYFEILKPFVGFNMLVAPLIKAVKRIYYRHPSFSKSLAKKKSVVNPTNVDMYLYRAWNKIVELDNCPWISKAIETQLLLQTKDEMHHQQRARVCLYYMFVKRGLMLKLQRHLAKKQKMKELELKSKAVQFDIDNNIEG